MFEHARCQLRGQIALCPLRTGIERQCALVKRDLLRVILTCGHPAQIQRPCTENVVQGIGLDGRSGGRCTEELEVERDRYSAGDLVLQVEQIAGVGIQAVGPQMGVSLGVDQLGADTNQVT